MAERSPETGDENISMDIEGGSMSDEAVMVIYNEWENIAKHPEVLTDLSEQKVMFAAGGGLVNRFGIEDSGLWQAMVKSSKDGWIKIAGIDFEIENLKQMGSYYRYLHDELGFSFHCIDERLEGDEEHLKDEVHVKCGACAEVGKATGLEDVEDHLLNELEQLVKQQVYEDMPDHESMVILADLHGADVVLGEARKQLKQKKALPFNASLPLDQIQAWVDINGGDASTLIQTLVKWNIQIARNIIGGGHNTLQKAAENTLLVIDSRKVGDHPFLPLMQEALDKIEPVKLQTLMIS